MVKWKSLPRRRSTWLQEILSIFTKGSRWFIGPTKALRKAQRVSEGPRVAGSIPNVNLTVKGGQKRRGWSQSHLAFPEESGETGKLPDTESRGEGSFRVRCAGQVC